MNKPTPAQLKKLEKLAKVLDGGDIALLNEVIALEERVEKVIETAEETVKIAKETKKMKGDRGEKGEKGDRGEQGEKGDTGETYILSAKDKKDIAKAIDVPVVEKVIEKTETIREIPIVTNEIREVATLDDALVGYLEDEIKRVEDKIETETKKETNFGFVIRDVVAGTGVTIDKSDPNRPVVTASAGANWTYYATKWDTAPTVNTTITGGTVYNYTLDGVTRYRFVADTYSPSTDSFYASFDGVTLSGLITSRDS